MKIVNQYKYLGVILHESLNYNITVNCLADAASRAFGAIINKLKYIKNCRYQTYTKLYESGIVPITDYNAGVWGFKSFDKIDVLHHKIIRYFLSVHHFAANHAIEGDMGWVPPVVRRLVSMTRLWNRLIDMPQDRLTQKVFDWDYSLCRNNWSFEVKNIFENCNLLHIYDDCSNCDTVTVKNILMDQYVEK